MFTASRTGFQAYIQSAVTRYERSVSYVAITPRTPTCSFPSAAGQPVLLAPTASSSASARLPRCLSRSTHTCCAMPVVLSSPMMATTRAPCSTTSGTRTFSTLSGTPNGVQSVQGLLEELNPSALFTMPSWALQAPASLGRVPARPRLALPLAGPPRDHFLNHRNGLIQFFVG